MKLKKIVENMNKMPSTLKGFNETPKLTGEQKNKLMEMMKNYNQLGQKLRMENSLIETATSLSEISGLAETYACNEAADWFATEVVKNDFKRVKGITENFQKLARECHSKVQQLNALYEDLGHVYGRYYEIADPMQEVAPNPTDIKGQRGLPNQNPQAVMEVKPNDKNIKSQRQLPANGALKEVAVDGMNANIKSQRDLPSGGPAPAQVKEVAVDGMNKNIKGQRELPHKNGPATPQVKEVAPPNDPKIYAKKGGYVNNPKIYAKKGGYVNNPKIYAKKGGYVNDESLNEVKPNDANLQSQRDLPSGGPESYTYEKVQNPSVPVNPAGSGECNVKGERDVPQGGPSNDTVYESMSLKEMLRKIKK